MADPRLLRRLDQVATRLRCLRGLWAGAIGWGTMALLVALLWWLGEFSVAWGVVLFGIPTTLLMAMIASARLPSDRQQAALLIERTYPQLDSRLLTAVQQQPRGHGWDFTYLQSELLSEVFTQLRRQDWHRAVAASRLWTAGAVHAVALLSCALVIVGMQRQHSLLATVAPANEPPAAARADWVVSVEPGDVELERGSSLLVLARFAERLPGEVHVVAQDAAGKQVNLPLQKSLDDPVYGGRIAEVLQDLSYHVEFDGERSTDFTVKTFVYPELLRADASIEYPDYAEKAPSKVENVRTLSVVEGSAVELLCQLNKGVQSATLIGDDEAKIELGENAADPLQRSAKWGELTPGKHRFRLELRDESGRGNREPPEFLITVTPNRTPNLEVAFPRKDLRISSLQELWLNASASDDFGLKGLGLIYQTPSGEEMTIDFSATAAAEQTQNVKHLLAMEQFNVQPNDLLSYYFYADDIGPDGQRRRSFSDIYFAEVRPFEEIFRQEEGQPGNGNSNCRKLLELQRQVVAGSWNVIRREQADTPSEKFSGEVKTLEDSQNEIRGLTQTLRKLLRDPLMQKYADEAIQHMAAAATQFQQAEEQRAVPPLTTGRGSAQDAYQSLLKLREREIRVMQSQGGGTGSPSAQNRMEQQLQALKLKNDRNRYETERQAKSRQREGDRAALDLLARLQELARRQEDLNQRMRELESALREAATPEQREEVERRLQRLQEEQEDVLRSLDEAREKSQQSPDHQQLSEARQKTEDARDRIARSAAALQQRDLSRALTEGVRAERQLQSVEEDLRRQTSGQFNEALRELRADARELARKEAELADQLDSGSGTSERPRPSLRDEQEQLASSLGAEFQQQKERLADVLNRTRQLVQDAEISEPLLSKKLYETLREQRAHRTEEALDNLAQLTQRGIRTQMAPLEQEAQKGIRQLQTGIEQAAESILGDEQSALQQARDELAQLTEAIRQELAAAAAESTETGDQTGTEATSQPEKSSASQTPKSAAPGSAAGEKPASASQGGGEMADSSSAPKPGATAPSQGSAGAGEKPGPATQPKSGAGSKPGENPSTAASPSSAGAAPGQSPNARSQGSSPQSSSGKEGTGQAAGQGQGQGKGRQNAQSTASGKQPSQGGSSSQGASSPSAAERMSRMLGLGGGTNAGGTGPEEGPLTGASYMQWTERMRDVEEMLSTPELRAQAAAIRDHVRLQRVDVKRHSKAPDWELVRTSIYGPLLELQAEVSEELDRFDPEKKLVPIDRDPVPDQYAEFVKRYYEELSRSRPVE